MTAQTDQSWIRTLLGSWIRTDQITAVSTSPSALAPTVYIEIPGHKLAVARCTDDQLDHLAEYLAILLARRGIRIDLTEQTSVDSALTSDLWRRRL